MAIGAATALVVTLVTLGLVLTTVGDLPRTIAEFSLAAVVFLVPVAVLAWFTRRRAFSRNDPACPWPPKR